MSTILCTFAVETASADAGNSFSIEFPAGTYIVWAFGSTAKVIIN